MRRWGTGEGRGRLASSTDLNRTSKQSNNPQACDFDDHLYCSEERGAQGTSTSTGWSGRRSWGALLGLAGWIMTGA